MEEDILNYLSTVMFRGTPCIWTSPNTKQKLKDDIIDVFGHRKFVKEKNGFASQIFQYFLV